MKKLTYLCSSDYNRHRNSMLGLHRRNYGKVSEALYDSLYSGNPHGNPFLGLCYDGETLAGQENYIRQDLAFENGIKKSALGLNTIVAEEYRLFYGVFKNLVEMTMKKMKEEVDFLCAFANEESKKYYLKSFDWKIAAKVQVHKKVISYSHLSLKDLAFFMKKGRLHEELSLREVAHFDPAELDDLGGGHVASAWYCSFHKDTAFLNWKYLNHRHYHLTGYVIEYLEKVCGYVVTWDDGIELKVIDLLIKDDDPEVLRKTLSTLAYIGCRKNKKHLVIYATPGCWYLATLKKNWFIFRWEFDFISASLNGKPIPDRWVLHIGDLDVF